MTYLVNGLASEVPIGPGKVYGKTSTGRTLHKGTSAALGSTEALRTTTGFPTLETAPCGATITYWGTRDRLDNMPVSYLCRKCFDWKLKK